MGGGQLVPWLGVGGSGGWIGKWGGICLAAGRVAQVADDGPWGKPTALLGYLWVLRVSPGGGAEANDKIETYAALIDRIAGRIEDAAEPDSHDQRP